ncbi:MAG: hypothetical protein CMM01_16860 [Rhodopirellula sp.]|nr:hypothetical protein [Rhodopirellula sp.]
MDRNATEFPQFLQRSRSDLLRMLVLVLLSGTAELVLNLKFASIGILDQYDVIFDIDPSRIHDNNWMHPLTHVVFFLITRSIAVPAYLVFGCEEILLGKILSLHVIPPCMAMLRAFFVYRAVKLLTGSSSTASLVCMLSNFSFATVVFGAINDTYVVTGAVVSALVFYTVRIAAGFTKKTDWCAFVLASILAIGTTSSNVIFVGWMLWVALRKFGYGHLNALAKSIAFSGFLLSVVILMGLMLSLIRHGGYKHGLKHYGHRYVSRYIPDTQEQLSNIFRFPENIARSIIPTSPRITPTPLYRVIDPYEKKEVGKRFIPYKLTYNGSPVSGWTVVLWLFGLLILALSNSHWPTTRSSRDFSRACGLTVITTGSLYSLFGLTTFLYATYWQIGVIFLLGRFVHHVNQTRTGTILLIITMLCLAVADFIVLSDLLEILKNYSRLPGSPSSSES